MRVKGATVDIVVVTFQVIHHLTILEVVDIYVIGGRNKCCTGIRSHRAGNLYRLATIIYNFTKVDLNEVSKKKISK